MDSHVRDNSIDWIQAKNPVNQKTYTSPDQQTPPPLKAAAAKQARMPKQRAQALINTLKKSIIVSSILGFGAFGLLAANQVVGTSTTTASSTSSTSASSTSASTTKASTSSSTSSSFFNQQGGSGFGSGSSSQSAVSSSKVS